MVRAAAFTLRPSCAGRLARGCAVVAAALLLYGCGDPAPDPGAQRSEAQSKELRDRIQQIQGRN